MKSLPEGATLVIASHNPGKVRRLQSCRALRSKGQISWRLRLAGPEENGSTFAENAAIKAKAAAAGCGLPALADDSGLSVAALDGQPGIYSARWAGADKNFTHAMQRVEEELGDTPDRRAEFVCALAMASPAGEVEHFEGRVQGCLVWPPRGDQGFGYDPIFVPNGETRTFGEMPPAEKHAISHRARAFARLKERLKVR